MLDLVISRDDEIWLRVCLCLPCCLIISLLIINVSLQKQSVSAKVISYRRYKSIDKEAFLADRRVSSLVLDSQDDVAHLVELYDSTLRDIVDQHAPLRTQEMPSRPMLPWYNKNIQAAKRHRRYCERLWIRTSCVFILKCSRSVKVLLKIPLPLLNLNIIIKRSKHPREIKGQFSVLWIKYYIKVKLSSQIISTQIKIWPIVLITSSVKKY